MTPQEQQQLEALIAENQRLKEQAVNLADANVYAAELLAALEERMIESVNWFNAGRNWNCRQDWTLCCRKRETNFVCWKGLQQNC